ncbi:MAG: hypothetical protein JWO03_3682 [Bacteroidetes bacterium]|nr:hypothetical protein [Bacteroidota bacterium]
MKKHLLFAITILCSVLVFGQAKNELKDALKPTELAINDTAVHYWKKSGFIGVNFGQVALVNWAGGGQNSISIQANANGTLTYQKKHFLWDNQLNFSLGGIAQGRLRQHSANNKYPFRKNVDLLQITTRAGYIIDTKKHWTATFLADLKTSLLRGYDYSGYDAGASDRQVVATPLSPSYLLLSLGINYKPVSYFSVFLSPATAKLTMMNNNTLRDKDDTTHFRVDRTRYGLNNDVTFRASVGAYLRVDFQKDIWKHINLKTSLEVFQNYTDKHMLDGIVQSEIKALDGNTSPEAIARVQDLQANHLYYDNRPNTYVNWATNITFTVNKFITASLETQLLYDHTAAVPHLNPDGTTYLGRGTQFREAFTLGFGYKFK